MKTVPCRNRIVASILMAIVLAPNSYGIESIRFVSGPAVHSIVQRHCHRYLSLEIYSSWRRSIPFYYYYDSRCSYSYPFVIKNSFCTLLHTHTHTTLSSMNLFFTSHHTSLCIAHCVPRAFFVRINCQFAIVDGFFLHMFLMKFIKILEYLRRIT